MNMAVSTQMPTSAEMTQSVEVRNSTDIALSKILYRLVDKFYLVIIVALLCGGLLGLYASENSVIQYSSTAKVFLANNVDALTTLGIADLQLGELMKQDYIAAFSNRHVHEEVIRKLDLPYTPEMMAGMISASYSDQSHLVYVTATSTSSEEAILLANTYVEVTTYFVCELIKNDAAAVWETAVTAFPFETMPKTTYFRFGIFGGTILVMVLIVVFTVFDDRIRIFEDVESRFALTQLGAVTKQKDNRPPRTTPILVCDDLNAAPYLHISNHNRPDLNGQDMIHTIASNLMFSIHHKNIIAVTSCANRDGKTYLAMQLAQTLAESGKKVAFVDGNLRKSTIKSKYAICGSENARYLEDYLSGRCDIDSCICNTNVPNMTMVLSNGACSNPNPLFNTPEFSELLQVLSEEYDVVLVDTHSAAKAMDASNIIHYCDGVLFVASYAHTKQRHIRDVLRKIQMTGCPVVGFVINRVKFDCMLSRKAYWHLRNG